MDNKKPVFLVRNFKVEGARSMGAGNTHLKLKISQENATFEVVAFGLGKLGRQSLHRRKNLELAVHLVGQPMEWPNSPPAHAGGCACGRRAAL